MDKTETFTFEKPNAFQISWLMKHIVDYVDEGGHYKNLHEKLDLSKEDYDYLFQNGGFGLSLIANDYVSLCEKVIRLYPYLHEKHDVPYTELKDILKM